MERILVTGGSGFIGTNLVEALGREGREVLNIDIQIPQRKEDHRYHKLGNILDKDLLLRLCQNFQPTVVIHLAARCDLAGRSLEDYITNTRGVDNIIDAVEATTSIERVVFASSRYVHKNGSQPTRDDEYSPFTYYGESKAQGERIVRGRALFIPWLIIRPTSIWGPWFKIPYRGFFDAVRRGLYFHPRGERYYKTYGYVGNVVHQIKALSTLPAELVGGKVFYVADYRPIEVLDLAECIRRTCSAPPVREAPLWMMARIAETGDILQKFGWYNPPLTSFRLSNLRAQMIYDMSRTEEVVGDLPFTTEEGVRETLTWMERYG